jgi:hypothetical protein
MASGGDPKRVEVCLGAAEKAVKYTRKILFLGSDNNWRRELEELSDAVQAQYGAASAEGAVESVLAIGRTVTSQVLHHYTKHELLMEARRRYEAYGTPAHGMEWPLFIDYCAHVAEDAHVGNCGEHAAVAFKYLMNYFEEAWPIDFMKFRDKDHNFVILNRPDEIPIEKFDEWSKYAVVCDPWKGAWGMAAKLDDWYGWTSMISKWRFPETER